MDLDPDPFSHIIAGFRIVFGIGLMSGAGLLLLHGFRRSTSRRSVRLVSIVLGAILIQASVITFSTEIFQRQLMETYPHRDSTRHICMGLRPDDSVSAVLAAASDHAVVTDDPRSLTSGGSVVDGARKYRRLALLVPFEMHEEFSFRFKEDGRLYSIAYERRSHPLRWAGSTESLLVRRPFDAPAGSGRTSFSEVWKWVCLD